MPTTAWGRSSPARGSIRRRRLISTRRSAPSWKRSSTLQPGPRLLPLRELRGGKAQFAEAIRLDPGCAEAYNASAMLMAACPEAKFRDGKKAVEFATRACELTKSKNPIILDTLAAAQAEAGDFDAAVRTQKKAIGLLKDEQRKDDYRSRLVLYQANGVIVRRPAASLRLKCADDIGLLSVRPASRVCSKLAGPRSGPNWHAAIGRNWLGHGQSARLGRLCVGLRLFSSQGHRILFSFHSVQEPADDDTAPKLRPAGQGAYGREISPALERRRHFRTRGSRNRLDPFGRARRLTKNALHPCSR